MGEDEKRGKESPGQRAEMKIEYEVEIGQAKTFRGACVRPLVSAAPHSSNGGIGARDISPWGGESERPTRQTMSDAEEGAMKTEFRLVDKTQGGWLRRRVERLRRDRGQR